MQRRITNDGGDVPSMAPADRGALAVQVRTTGFSPLDDLVDGVRVGDNLVYSAAGGIDLAPFTAAFVRGYRGRPLVYVNASEPAARVRRRLGDAWDSEHGVLLDWRRLPATRGESELAALDDRLGEGAVYVFDSLTALQQRWGADEALRFFAWACPRLYRHRTVALWTLDRDAHTPAFLAQLAEITQVVFELDREDAATTAEVTEADGRPSDVVGRRIRFVVDGEGGLDDVVSLPARRDRTGQLIRAERLSRGIGQADLARQARISPSALSQVERGISGLSGDSLTRIWEILGVPFGPTVSTPGFQIMRRGGHREARLAPGVDARQLIDERHAVTVWRLTVAPETSGRGPLFPVKDQEAVIVLAGILTLEIDGTNKALQEGDAALVDSAPITGWANPAAVATEVLWVIHRRGGAARGALADEPDPSSPRPRS